jgi:hypothetical protein
VVRFLKKNQKNKPPVIGNYTPITGGFVFNRFHSLEKTATANQFCMICWYNVMFAALKTVSAALHVKILAKGNHTFQSGGFTSVFLSSESSSIKMAYACQTLLEPRLDLRKN